MEKASIFKLSDGFTSMALKEPSKIKNPQKSTGEQTAAPCPPTLDKQTPQDLLESRAPTQDSTETLPLSACNRVATHPSSAEIHQHAASMPAKP
ncbi:MULTISPECIES: hypothetical protein [unclassified Mesorhizobium]|uniref:hypothetical protein n=1 Tax=unclassified Mesorhizobium TaxID=325217 RepID=UPI001596D4E4|nr:MULTISPECIES: hypothetical protein [unclassified Mesorhizobium]